MGKSCFRLAAATALAMVLAGCSSEGNSTYQAYGRALGQAVDSVFTPGSISRQTAAAIPYASMGYRLNGGDQALLILATSSDRSQLWTAASHVVLQTDNGRITRTVGLPRDLGGEVPDRASALIPPAAALRAPFRSTRLEDFPQSTTYGAPVTCSAKAAGTENIAILGQTIATVRIDESCASPSLDWQFVDNYWLDPKNGFVWRSLQHISPDGETVETEIFRPPG